jgi:hypothetical protein
MIVSIGKKNGPQLLDPDNFRAFRVDIPADSSVPELKLKTFPNVVFEGENIAWVAEAWLRTQNADEAWRRSLADMIEKVRPHGWVRDTPILAVRAHVERVTG